MGSDLLHLHPLQMTYEGGSVKLHFITFILLWLHSCGRSSPHGGRIKWKCFAVLIMDLLIY